MVEVVAAVVAVTAAMNIIIIMEVVGNYNNGSGRYGAADSSG